MKNGVIVAEKVADVDNRQGDNDKNSDATKVSETAAEEVDSSGEFVWNAHHEESEQTNKENVNDLHNAEEVMNVAQKKVEITSTHSYC